MSQREPDDRQVILFVSSNGTGVGHVMRLMAMARRASDSVCPFFITMSPAVSVVRKLGFPVEYIPSYSQAGLGHVNWHHLLYQRLTEIIDTHQPVALVFDGTHPYRGLLTVIPHRPDLAYVWSRRAMWKPDVDDRILAVAKHFDLILEPGEFGAAVDVGATASHRDQVTRVGPILYLDDDELLGREESKRTLGIDPNRPAVLVQLGAGDLDDNKSVLGRVVQRLREEPDIQICLAESAISLERARELDVHRFSVYPLARYLRAFDFAIAAAGYNTFHELVGFGVPSIFVPSPRQTDDQAARADFAESVGVGLSLHTPDRGAFDRALSRMLDPLQRQKMAKRAREQFPSNGAGPAMAAIERTTPHPRHTGFPEARTRSHPARRARLARSRPQPVGGQARGSSKRLRIRMVRWLGAAFRRLPQPVRRRLRSVGQRIAERLRTDRAAPVVMLLLPHMKQGRIEDLLDFVIAKQTTDPSFNPVFVGFKDDLRTFRQRDALFEYVMDEHAWEQTQQPMTWDDYVSQRMMTLTASHRPKLVISVSNEVSFAVIDSTIDAITSFKPRRQRSGPQGAEARAEWLDEPS